MEREAGGNVEWGAGVRAGTSVIGAEAPVLAAARRDGQRGRAHDGYVRWAAAR